MLNTRIAKYSLTTFVVGAIVFAFVGVASAVSLTDMGTRLIKVGSRGDDVRAVQQALMNVIPAVVLQQLL